MVLYPRLEEFVGPVTKKYAGVALHSQWPTWKNCVFCAYSAGFCKVKGPISKVGTFPLGDSARNSLNHNFKLPPGTSGSSCPEISRKEATILTGMIDPDYLWR